MHMPVQSPRPQSARLSRVLETQPRARPDTAPGRRASQRNAALVVNAGALELISDDTDPLDESLDRSRDVVSAFLDLQRKLERSESRLTEEIQAHAHSSQTVRALEASDVEVRRALKVALSRLEETEVTTKLRADQLRLTEEQLLMTREEVARLQAVNASLSKQMESQRADFMGEAEQYVERFAAIKAKHEVLQQAYDSMQRQYALTNSALDSAIEAHQVYKADVHSIQAGFERVLSMQQQELERLMVDCISSKKAQSQLDRVLMTNKRLEDSMAAAEANAMRSMSHAMKVLRKQIFAQDIDILNHCFENWLDAVVRAKAKRKRKEQNVARTLRGITAHNEAIQAHFLTLWARSARALKRECLLRARSVNVLIALENQFHQQVEELTCNCFDGWRGIIGRKRTAKLRQEKLLRRGATISSRMLLMDCMLALMHLIQVVKRERHLEANRQKVVQALRKQLHNQGLVLHDRVLEYWRDFVVSAKECRQRKGQNISRALRIQSNLDDATQAQCFVSWAYAVEVTRQGHALETHRHKALAAFQKQMAQCNANFLHRCFEHWRSGAGEAQCCRERLRENIDHTLRSIVVQEKQLRSRCFSFWVNEVSSAVHIKKLRRQREHNVARSLRGVHEIEKSVLKQCFLSWFWAVAHARRLSFEQSSLEMRTKLEAFGDVDERLATTRARNEQLLYELNKLRQECDEANQGLDASRMRAAEFQDVARQRDDAVEKLTHAESAREELKKTIAAMEQEIQQLKLELEAVNVERSDAESRATIAREEDRKKIQLTNQLLEQSAKDLAAVEEQCQDEIKRLTNALAESEHSNELLRARQEDAEKLHAVLKELAKHRDNTKALFELSQRSYEEHTVALQDVAFSLASAQEELRQSKERLASAESEVAKLRAAKQSLEQERDDAQRQVSAIELKLSKLIDAESTELLKQQTEALNLLKGVEERLASASNVLQDREKQLIEAQSAIEKANDRYRQQALEIAKLEKELEVAQEQRARAERDLEDAEQRLKDPVDAVRRLTERINEASSELVERDQKMVALRKEVETLKGQRKTSVIEMEEMRQKQEEEIERLTIALTESKHSNDLLRAHQADAEKLQAVLKELSKHRDNTKALLDFYERSSDENTIALRDFAFSLASAQEELRQSEERLASVENEVGKLRAAKLSLEQERDDAHKQCQNIEVELSKLLDAESSELLKQQTEALKLLKDVEERLATASNILQDREKQLLEAQQAIEKATDRYRQQALEIAKLEKEVEVLQVQHARAERDLEEAERRLKDPVDAVRHLTERLKETSSDLEEREKQIVALLQEVEAVKAQRDMSVTEMKEGLSEARQASTKLQLQAEQLQMQFADSELCQIEKDRSLVSLQVDLDDTKKRCEELKRELSDSELKNIELTRQLQAAPPESLARELDDMRRQLDEANANMNASKADQDDLRQKLLLAKSKHEESGHNYQKALEQLEQRCQDLQLQVADSERRSEETARELRIVQEGLGESDDGLKKLTQELDDSRSQRDDLRSKLDACEQQVEGLRQKLSAAQNKNDDVEAALEQLMKRYEDFQRQLAESEARSEETAMQLRTLQENQGEVDNPLKQLTQELNELRCQRDELRMQLDACEQEKEGLRLKLSAAHSKSDDAEEAFKQLTQRCEDLQRQVADSGRQEGLAESGLQKLAQELDELKHQRDEARSKLDACEHEKQDLRQELLAAQCRNEEADKVLEEVEHRCRDLERQLAESESRNKELARELRIVQEGLGEHNDGLKILAQELDDSRCQGDEARRRLGACEQEKEDLNHKLSATQRRNKEIEEAYQMELDQIKQRCEELQHQLIDAESRYEGQSQELRSLTEALNEAEPILTDLESRTENQGVRIDTLEARLGESDVRVQSLMQELDETRQQRDEASDKLDVCQRELDRLIVAQKGADEVASKLVDAERKIFELLSDKNTLQQCHRQSVWKSIDLGSKTLLQACLLRWNGQAHAARARQSRMQAILFLLQRRSVILRVVLGKCFVCWVFAKRIAKHSKTSSSKQAKLICTLEAEIRESQSFSTCLVIRLWRHSIVADRKSNFAMDRKHALGMDMTQIMANGALKRLACDCFHFWSTRTKDEFGWRRHIADSIEGKENLCSSYRIVLAFKTWNQAVVRELHCRLAGERKRRLGMGMSNLILNGATKQLRLSCFELWHMSTKASHLQHLATSDDGNKHNDELDQRVQEALALVAKAELDSEQLRNALLIAENVAASLRSEAAKAANENDRLRSEITKCENEMEALRGEATKSDLVMLQGKLSAAENLVEMLRLEIAKVSHEVDTLRGGLAKAEHEAEILRSDLDGSREQNRMMHDRLMQEQASQDMQHKMDALLSTATSALARSQTEEATLIAWMRQERDESRCRLEVAERRCTELSESLQKRESQIRDMRIELEHYQGTLRRARLEHGSMYPRGYTDYQQILLLHCLRAWSFWFPRRLATTSGALASGRSSPSIDRSGRPLSALSAQGSPSAMEDSGLESWSHPIRPPSAARNQWRPSRTLPLRPSSAMDSMRNGTLTRPTSAMSASSGPGNGSLVKQLTAVFSSPVGALANEQ